MVGGVLAAFLCSPDLLPGRAWQFVISVSIFTQERAGGINRGRHISVREGRYISGGVPAEGASPSVTDRHPPGRRGTGKERRGSPNRPGPRGRNGPAPTGVRAGARHT